MKKEIDFVSLVPKGILPSNEVFERLYKIKIRDPLDYNPYPNLKPRELTKEDIKESCRLAICSLNFKNK